MVMPYQKISEPSSSAGYDRETGSVDWPIHDLIDKFAAIVCARFGLARIRFVKKGRLKT